MVIGYRATQPSNGWRTSRSSPAPPADPAAVRVSQTTPPRYARTGESIGSAAGVDGIDWYPSPALCACMSAIVSLLLVASFGGSLRDHNSFLSPFLTHHHEDEHLLLSLCVCVVIQQGCAPRREEVSTRCCRCACHIEALHPQLCGHGLATCAAQAGIGGTQDAQEGASCCSAQHQLVPVGHSSVQQRRPSSPLLLLLFLLSCSPVCVVVDSPVVCLSRLSASSS